MQQVILAFPVSLERAGPDEIIVRCRELPEVLTSGANTD